MLELRETSKNKQTVFVEDLWILSNPFFDYLFKLSINKVELFPTNPTQINEAAK